MSDYLMRSLMFVPAHSDKLMTSAMNVEADVLLFDIETPFSQFITSK